MNRHFSVVNKRGTTVAGVIMAVCILLFSLCLAMRLSSGSVLWTIPLVACIIVFIIGLMILISVITAGIDVKNGNVARLPELVADYGEEKLAKEIEIGVPTMLDIVSELVKPGRDIREEAEHLELRSDVLGIEDLKDGMVLKGTVRNVIDFGAYVDIGVHQDGLVHISEICDRYIKHPSEELTVGQIVNVKVISLDIPKKRIGLSIKKAKEE